MGRAFEVTPMEIEGREALMLDVPESVRCVPDCDGDGVVGRGGLFVWMHGDTHTHPRLSLASIH